MDLIKPAFGLIFWMAISFFLVLFLLRKYAWKPILGILHDRDASIKKALEEAEEAKMMVRNMKVEKEKIINEGRVQRDQILKEAREAKNTIIEEARIKAKEEGQRILQMSREALENERKMAVAELKNQVADISIEIAEKVLAKELSNDRDQKALISDLVKDIKLN